MKHIVTAILLFIAIPAHAAEVMSGPYRATPYSVYDGDTFRAHINIWLGQTVSMPIRIDGIDTPEKRTKCTHEKALALEAKAALEELLKGDVELTNVRYGKWAGRVLARVTVNGVDVADVLISKGLARPYDGGKRQGWCD